MQTEAACDRLCDDIATLLLLVQPATPVAAFAAARATRDVASALHHAAGDPANPRWHDAIESLEHFLNYPARSPEARASSQLLELRAFVEENAA